LVKIDREGHIVRRKQRDNVPRCDAQLRKCASESVDGDDQFLVAGRRDFCGVDDGNAVFIGRLELPENIVIDAELRYLHVGKRAGDGYGSSSRVLPFCHNALLLSTIHWVNTGPELAVTP